jgi:hypothetical protein
VDRGPQVGTKTRDLAGKKAGFGSGKQSERAKSVVERAAPEVVEAMDNGVVSIRAAATIAKTPERAECIEEWRKITLKGANGLHPLGGRLRIRCHTV